MTGFTTNCCVQTRVKGCEWIFFCTQTSMSTRFLHQMPGFFSFVVFAIALCNDSSIWKKIAGFFLRCWRWFNQTNHDVTCSALYRKSLSYLLHIPPLSQILLLSISFIGERFFSGFEATICYGCCFQYLVHSDMLFPPMLSFLELEFSFAPAAAPSTACLMLPTAIFSSGFRNGYAFCAGLASGLLIGNGTVMRHEMTKRQKTAC